MSWNQFYRCLIITFAYGFAFTGQSLLINSIGTGVAVISTIMWVKS